MIKDESKFWREFKEDTPEISWTRVENSVSLGTPDLLGYARSGTFFTLELKIVRRNKKGIGKVLISPLQLAWNTVHVVAGAPVYTLVLDPGHRTVKLFTSAKLQELRDMDYDSVPGALYEGPLAGLQLSKLLKLPNSR